MRSRPIVAIDGPAASGKSTTARAVAERLGFTHFDSGAVYRAMTLVALQDSGDPARWTGEAIVARAAARGLAVRAVDGAMHVRLDGREPGEALRTAAVTAQVSRVAAMPPVRQFVNGLLRSGAAHGGVVMDGRDIGTVVFPDAEVKVFMVADPDERARRRLIERGVSPDAGTVRSEAGALVDRDRKDATRTDAPLVAAPDAVRIDTTRLSFEDQVRMVVELARKASRD